jgi:hypothetical protein
VRAERSGEGGILTCGLRVAAAAALAAAVVVVAPLACHGSGLREPLEGLLASPEAVAEAVIERLARRDLAGLRALALTEAEFKGRVWPELPASRPQRNLTADYVWNDFAQKSDRHLRPIVARRGGERWTLQGVRFNGATTDYQSFRVRRKTVLEVENADGARETVRLFGSLLQQGGRFKVFSYVID